MYIIDQCIIPSMYHSSNSEIASDRNQIDKIDNEMFIDD